MALDMTQIQAEAIRFLRDSEYNRVRKEEAIHESLVDLQLFDEPIFAVGDARDPLFRELRNPGVIHSDYWLPEDWNSEARSVLSYFLPFTEEVRKANAADMTRACPEWLHARIEGQRMLGMLGEHLVDILGKAGFSSTLPMKDSRFAFLAPLVSNWSERHTAFICGLGTFGISKGLITEKGMAGRFGSVITSAELPVTPREYTGVYEYCIMCGLCQKNCPVDAIYASRPPHEAKDHGICEAFCHDETLAVFSTEVGEITRYGCGKCQVSVPCESRNPSRPRR